MGLAQIIHVSEICHALLPPVTIETLWAPGPLRPS